MMLLRLFITGSIFFIAVPRILLPRPVTSQGSGARHPNHLAAQANTAPEVRIVSPAEGQTSSAGALIPYAVTVSDKEDGESKFEEIPATEVFMELHFFADAAKAAAYRKTAKKDYPGYTLFKNGDCYNCHAVHSKVIGPSFSEIAAKYKKPEDISVIAGHIVKGSTGIWGTAVMPTHPDLKEKDAQEIVRWILIAGRDRNTDYFRGAEGAFRLPAPVNSTPVKSAAKASFLLKASYTDHGLDKSNTGTLTGQDVKTIKVQ